MFFLPLASFLSGEFILGAILLSLVAIAVAVRVKTGRFFGQSLVYVLPVAVSVFILYFIFERQMPLVSVFGEAAILSLRFALAIASGVLFSLATDPMEFPLGFMQARIPHRFGVSLMVSYRMMPLLSKKISTVVDAQRGRGASFNFNISHPLSLLYRFNSLVIPIIYNTLSMSVRISDTLIARGYDPYGKMSFPPAKIGVADIVILSISAAIFALSIFR